MADPLQDATDLLYRQAALEPDVGLCCTTTPIWKIPGLSFPTRMLEMNYGCGSTVHPRDLDGSPAVLYVGIGGAWNYFNARTSHAGGGRCSVWRSFRR